MNLFRSHLNVLIYGVFLQYKVCSLLQLYQLDKTRIDQPLIWNWSICLLCIFCKENERQHHQFRIPTDKIYIYLISLGLDILHVHICYRWFDLYLFEIYPVGISNRSHHCHWYHDNNLLHIQHTR